MTCSSASLTEFESSALFLLRDIDNDDNDDDADEDNDDNLNAGALRLLFHENDGACQDVR